MIVYWYANLCDKVRDFFTNWINKKAAEEKALELEMLKTLKEIGFNSNTDSYDREFDHPTLDLKYDALFQKFKRKSPYKWDNVSNCSIPRYRNLSGKITTVKKLKEVGLALISKEMKKQQSRNNQIGKKRK